MKKTTTKNSSRAATVEKKPDALSAVMTLPQLAEYLVCHPSTIYRLLRRRQIPAFKLHADWRFLRANIDQWISARYVKPEDADEHKRKPRGRPPKSRL